MLLQFIPPIFFQEKPTQTFWLRGWWEPFWLE